MEKVERRRESIYKYICTRIDEGSSPTVREICTDLRISSTSTVHSDLKALCLSGLIEMTGGLNRTIKLPGEPAIRVPLLGEITAGTPIMAVQNIEQYIPIGLPGLKGKALFALHVKDDSMEKSAILNGDIVIAEQTSGAQNGQIIVALLNGELSVKRYYKENGHFRLQPENDAMQPIIVDNIDILGRVLCVQRVYL